MGEEISMKFPVFAKVPGIEQATVVPPTFRMSLLGFIAPTMDHFSAPFLVVLDGFVAQSVS